MEGSCKVKTCLRGSRSTFCDLVELPLIHHLQVKHMVKRAKRVPQSHCFFSGCPFYLGFQGFLRPLYFDPDWRHPKVSRQLRRCARKRRSWRKSDWRLGSERIAIEMWERWINQGLQTTKSLQRNHDKMPVTSAPHRPCVLGSHESLAVHRFGIVAPNSPRPF